METRGDIVEVVRAGALEIVYRRIGEGPPLVFVHGAADDGRIWQPQLAALADEFTVVAWDEPGAGRSSDLPAKFALADYAHCLEAVVREVGLGPAHIAGLSWGGTVAQELYRHHPCLVATLILIDTYAGWRASLPAQELRDRIHRTREMLAAPSAAFDTTLPGLFASNPPAEFVALLEEIAADVRPENLARQVSIMAETDERDLLPQIAVPTLLIWGELDTRSPLSVAHQFEQAIPDTKFVIIPGAGHLRNLEKPELVNEAVRTSVALTRRAGAGAPAGRTYHVALESDGAIQVVDIWESQEQFEAFGQTLIPILSELGVDPGQPMSAKVHNVILG